MPAPIQVPPRSSLKALAALPARQAAAVAKGVEGLPPYASRHAARAAVERALSNKWKGSVDGAELVSSLAAVIAQVGDRPIERIASEVAESQALEVPAQRRAAFARVLTRLLKAEVVSTFGKADEIITDHAHVFQEARILTDVRPVFGDDPDELPSAAVIVGMLRIDFFGRREGAKSFFVALDQADLVKLRETVDRALRKTETMKQFLTSAGLTYFEHQEVPRAADGSEPSRGGVQRGSGRK
jgi:hypothetical protein